jgi:hypothetical protein
MNLHSLPIIEGRERDNPLKVLGHLILESCLSQSLVGNEEMGIIWSCEWKEYGALIQKT